MKDYILGTLTGAVLGGCCLLVFFFESTPAEGQGFGVVRGAGEAGVVDEQLVWTGGKREKRKATIRRTVIRVPKSYGQLLKIAGSADQVLWFVDQEGTMRNVILGNKLVKIELGESR